MRELLRDSLSSLRASRLWLMQVLLNPLALIAYAAWLLIPDAHVWQLLATAVLALAIVIGELWLHSGTLASLATPPEGFRRALRHLLAFALWAAIFALLLWAISSWGESSWQYSGYLTSKLPRGVRGVSTGVWLDWVVGFAFAAAFWYVIPVVLLPFGVEAAQRGFSFRGLRAAGGILRRFSYWLLMAPLAVAMALIPGALIGWFHPSTLRMEAIGVVLRLGSAYLIAIVLWMLAASIVGAASRRADPDSASVQG